MVYLSREYAPLEKREAAFIAYEKTLPGIAANIRANLKTPLPRTFPRVRALPASGGFAKFFKDNVPKIFAGVKDPALTKDLAVCERRCHQSDGTSSPPGLSPSAPTQRMTSRSARNVVRTDARGHRACEYSAERYRGGKGAPDSRAQYCSVEGRRVRNSCRSRHDR